MPDSSTAGEDPAALSHQETVRLRAAVGRIGRGLRSSPGTAALPPSALDALGTLVRRGPLRPSDLAAAEGLNPTMCSRLAAQLEDQGLVERLAHPGDGRSVSLAATPAGSRLHAEALARRLEALRGALAKLAPGEQGRLRDALPALEGLAGALRGPRSGERPATVGDADVAPPPAGSSRDTARARRAARGAAPARARA